EGKIYAQYDLPKGWDKTAVRIDRLTKDTSPLGTGFFICNEQKEVYLVTNRHVVAGRDSAIFTFFVADSGFVRRRFSLKENLFIHPDTTIDLAIYLVIMNGTLHCIGTDKILSSEKLVEGEIIYTFSYPLGQHIGNEDSIFPIPKDGAMLKISGDNMILTCLSYNGSSGSPVLTSNRYSKDGMSKLIGIVYSHVPNPATENEVGLAVAVRADKLRELLNYAREHRTKPK
ncbi:MAG TPA: serine protease, partial [candidate division Zixibacteria bacterium]|nr:serine protease [candidate division Zixibacteria bacterium]